MENMDTDLSDMTAESCLSLGDSYAVDEAYELAVDAYAAALSLLTTDSDSWALRLRILSHRAAAFLVCERYQEALEDAQTALSIQDTAGLRPGERELCHKRLGKAAFKLARYDEAQVAFEAARQLAELNHRDVNSYQEWIEECLDLMSPTKSAAATAPHSAIDLPSTVASKQSSQAATPGTASAETPSEIKTKPKAPSASIVPKYQYYQSSNVMTVAVLEPNVKPQDLRVDFEPKRLTVVLTKGGRPFTVVCGTLTDEVVVEKCRVVYKDEKVLIKLRKKDSVHEWQQLISKVEEPTPAPETSSLETNDIPTVDSSKPRAYASHRDWDAIERNLKEQEKQEKPEGEEALNKLLQQIYGNADDDARRAMVKSYQTSGGTVLSTDWKDVEKKDYEKERVAPKGMEWKTYEGDKLEQKED